MDDEIRIVSGIQFTCNTQINSVIIGIDVRSGENRQMFPSLQLWRPTGDGGAVYELVEGSERPIVYTPANVSNIGVYEFPLIPSIDVTEGDLIAISQPDERRSIVRCYTVKGIPFVSFTFEGTMITTVDLSGNPTNDELVLIFPVTGEEI